jgi:hypothetical protein
MTNLNILHNQFYEDKVLYNDGYRYLFKTYLPKKVNPKVTSAERWYCDRRDRGCKATLDKFLFYNAEYEDMNNEVEVHGNHSHPPIDDWRGYHALVVSKDEDISLDFLNEASDIEPMEKEECSCVCKREEKIQSVSNPDESLLSVEEAMQEGKLPPIRLPNDE